MRQFLGKKKQNTNLKSNSKSNSQKNSLSFPSSFKLEDYSYDKIKKIIIEDEEEKEFIKTNKIKEQKEKNNKLKNLEVSQTIDDIIKRNEHNNNNSTYDKESSSSSPISFSNFDELESEFEISNNSNFEKDSSFKNNNLRKKSLIRKREKDEKKKKNENKEKIKKEDENNDLKEFFEEFDEEIKEHKIKKLKKNKENKELKISLDEECSICMNSIIDLANTDVCEHDFCKNCLLSWANKSTQCPICKKNFSKIFIYYKGKKIEIKFDKKKYIPYISNNNSESYYSLNDSIDDNPCYVCNRFDDPNNMLICDKCDVKCCHYYCDGLKKLPKKNEKWFCSECKQFMKEEKKKIKEIGKKLFE